MSLRLHKWGGAAEQNCLEGQLWWAAGLSWERWEGKALSSTPPGAEGHCFTFLLLRMRRPFRPCGQSGPCWAVVLLLGCVSSWDRCLVQRALRSLICLSVSRALLMCQGRNLPFRASLLWCHSVLLPVWRHKNICPSIFVWKAPILPFLFRSVSMKRNACELSYCKAVCKASQCEGDVNNAGPHKIIWFFPPSALLVCR